MSLIEGMQTLKKEIKVSRGRRKQDLKAVREDTEQVRQDTRRAISDFKETRKEEAENLARDLTSFAKDLTRDVSALREEFRQDQTAVREEVLAARAIWHGTASTAKEERTDDKGEEKGKEGEGSI
jgi:gas vesicle protein